MDKNKYRAAIYVDIYDDKVNDLPDRFSSDDFC